MIDTDIPAEVYLSKSVPPDAVASSIIGLGLHINGDVISDGDVLIEGIIVGDVKSRRVNLGLSGEVRGEVVADQLQVSGRVVGQIRARTVSLTRSARVEGDVLHEVLVVEAGAQIEGGVRRVNARSGQEPVVEQKDEGAGGDDTGKTASTSPAKPVATGGEGAG